MAGGGAYIPEGIGVGGEVAGGVAGGPAHHGLLRRQAAHSLALVWPDSGEDGGEDRWRRRGGGGVVRVGLALGEHR